MHLFSKYLNMAILVRLKIFIKIIVEIISFIISVGYNTNNCNSSIVSNYCNASHIESDSLKIRLSHSAKFKAAILGKLYESYNIDEST